jgi:predicted 3-demethylubiquinone-9 3-methyltransferase (glyoxalase superfamily)
MVGVEKLTPWLWFNDNAGEALEFYASVFPEAEASVDVRFGEGGQLPPGSVMVGTLRVFGQTLRFLNGGSHYQLSPAVSLMVLCDDQEELDRYWNLLLAGGQEMACGWLTDRYGLSWQITPRVLMEMIGDSDPARVERVTQAMLGMIKLDIAQLEQAYKG